MESRILDLVNQVNEEATKVDILNDKIDTLNKGIDELIKKYEDEINNNYVNNLWSDTNDSGEEYPSEQFYQREIYLEIINDLKSLKGE